MEKEKRHLLATADWKRLTLELTNYAKYRVKGKVWRTGSKTRLAEGKTVEDLVQEAVKRAFDETRHWDPERVDLLGFLKGIVKSMTSHLAKSADNTSVWAQRESEDAPSAHGAEAISADPSPNPEEQFIAREEQEAVDLAYRLVLEKVEGQPELEGVTLCLMEGKHKPQEIAEELGVEVKRVYQLKRQLIGILNSVAETFNTMPVEGAVHAKR